jgi:hypothetical protein
MSAGDGGRPRQGWDGARLIDSIDCESALEATYADVAKR